MAQNFTPFDSRVRIGHVHLKVADLERALKFYCGVLGFELQQKFGRQAAVRDVPKAIGEYYAAGVFPAYGLFARQVRGLTLNNVRFEIAASDLRPAVVFDHVQDAAVNGLNVQGDNNSESALRIIDSQDVLLSASRLLKPAPVFLQVEGVDNGNIIVDGGDISKAAAPLAFKNGASENSVKLRA